MPQHKKRQYYDRLKNEHISLLFAHSYMISHELLINIELYCESNTIDSIDE